MSRMGKTTWHRFQMVPTGGLGSGGVCDSWWSATRTQPGKANLAQAFQAADEGLGDGCQFESDGSSNGSHFLMASLRRRPLFVSALPPFFNRGSMSSLRPDIGACMSRFHNREVGRRHIGSDSEKAAETNQVIGAVLEPLVNKFSHAHLALTSVGQME